MTPFGPVPVSLAGFGAPGCNLLLDPLVLTFVPNVSGTGNWSIGIPNQAGFIGMQLVNQGMALVNGVNALGAVVTNGGEGVVGN
jgi:hypothetical protein